MFFHFVMFLNLFLICFLCVFHVFPCIFSLGPWHRTRPGWEGDPGKGFPGKGGPEEGGTQFCARFSCSPPTIPVCFPSLAVFFVEI